MSALEIKDVSAEAGVISSAILKPELIIYSNDLKPDYFSDEANKFMYMALSNIAAQGIRTPVNTYRIIAALKQNRIARERQVEILPEASIEELIQNANILAVSDYESYMMLVNNVIEAAFRRNLHNKLTQCQNLCADMTHEQLSHEIYSILDGAMLDFSATSEIPQYKDVVEDLWSEIRDRQDGKNAGVKFKFPTLNKYATLERGELFIFGAAQKQGKSMMLLNIAVDLMQKGLGVLYIDSELSSRMFTARMISHLTKIPFGIIKNGPYTEEQERRISNALAWLKEQRFTHLYLPVFDSQGIYTAVKKVQHTQGLDAVIIDYFKGPSDSDAFAVYQNLGNLVDLVKNRIAGEMNLITVGAAQTKASTGMLADSAKIARNASTIAFITEKTPEEIEMDGGEHFGNKKLQVKFNRNGRQHGDGEYISLDFRGDIILYEECEQPERAMPF